MIAYNNTTESLVANERWRLTPDYLLIIGGLVSTTGLLLNTVHFMILTHMPVGRTQGAANGRFVLKAVAVVDIIMLLVKLPLENRYVQSVLSGSKALCGFTAITGYTALYSAQMMMAIGCLDKLILIAKPSRYFSNPISRNLKKILFIPVIWFLTWLVTLVLQYHTTILVPRGFCICYLDVSKLKLLQIFVTISALMPSTLTVVMYIIILKIIHKTDRLRTTCHTSQTLRAATYILIIMLTQLICWVPPAINATLHSTIGVFVIEVFYLAPTLSTVGSLIRPILYGTMDITYRRFVRRKFCMKQETETLENAFLRVRVIEIHQRLSTVTGDNNKSPNRY